MTYHGAAEANPRKTDMIMMPPQMLDAHPPRITDFGLPYRHETGVIMAKIRDMKGAAGRVSRNGTGGVPGGFRCGDIWYTIQPSPEAATASGACGYQGYCLPIR
jgi:hypothetical protein